MKIYRLIFTCICILLSAGFLEGKDSLSFLNLSHRITLEARPTYNMPTHGYYRGYNDLNEAVPGAGAIHLKYGFSLNPESSLGSLYPTAYQGIGIGAQSFFHHSMTGTPALIYIFQGSRIADFSDKVSIGYEWNLGASYGWKINDVVSSRWNIYINVGIPITWHISPTWDLYLGPEFTHFSNGDTSFPNGGANTVGCRIGLTAKINEGEGISAPAKAFISREDGLDEKKFRDRITYDLTAFGAWRAARISGYRTFEIINDAFPVAGICFNPLYRLNRYFSTGPSADMTYSASSGLDIENGKTVTPKVTEQLSCGISARAELSMPFFSVNIGAGYGFSSGQSMRGFYTTYTLKGFLTSKIYINIGYRLSGRQYCHNLMMGIGVRL